MSTIFERIAKKEIPAHILFEDDRTIAFLDINPLRPGHTLVIPKKAFKNIFDMPPKELAHLMTVTKKVSNILRKKLHCDGVNILHASGEAAQQSVLHFHLHIIPRMTNDGVDLWPKVEPVTHDITKFFREKFENHVNVANSTPKKRTRVHAVNTSQ